MSDIKVNKIIWDAISEQDKQHIVTHLRQFGVLLPEQNIVPDAQAAFPVIRPHINDKLEDVKNVNALCLDWICRAICDTTNAATHCMLYGQPLSACFAIISASREAFSGSVYQDSI